MHTVSVFDHVGGQLDRLCQVLDLDPDIPLDLLAGILGPHRERPLSEPPIWPSDIADDHSSVEFSVAYNDSEPPALRILAEVPGTPPGVSENMSAAYRFLAGLTGRFGLSTRRLESVRDLFTVDRPHGRFGLWCSLVFRRGRAPEFKVYLNPELHGPDRAPDLVDAALHRLGLGASYRAMLAGAVRPGELGRSDRLAFFALDLHDGPQARVKVYLSHYDAEATDVARAAGIVDGIEPAEIVEFCSAAGGPGPFTARPLIGSYTLTEGTDRPVGYSVYVPIRSYVGDDQEARNRTAAVLSRHGFDPGLLDRAIAAVTTRSLPEGVGLLAHVSLRLGPPRPGVTVYLSTEAYEVCPPARPLRVPAA
jgi:DMATS type aromatic prenyltransferase